MNGGWMRWKIVKKRMGEEKKSEVKYLRTKKDIRKDNTSKNILQKVNVHKFYISEWRVSIAGAKLA